MQLHTPNPNKLIRSLSIVTAALVVLIILKWVFPTFDWVHGETAILTAVTAWLVNTVKESTT